MKEKILELFNNNKSPYAIHQELGVGIKEVYHHLKQNEEQANSRKRRSNES